MREKFEKFEKKELAAVREETQRLRNENKRLKLDYFRIEQALKKKGLWVS